MIETKNLTMSYSDVKALENVNTAISDGSIFGLVGTNGAGKSTFLKLCAGILRPVSGSVEVDGSPVFENPAIKGNIFYISDDQYYPATYTPVDLVSEYSLYYPNMNKERFSALCRSFSLPTGRKINTFSKGMKKQLSVILGICSGCEYLLCDETFDGLDPVMRQAVKSLFASETQDRKLTPVIASHNLRELEDICDHVGLLYNGGILFSKELDDLKLNIHRLQLVLNEGQSKDDLFTLFNVASISERGSLITLTVRGDREETQKKLDELKPLFSELIDLTLEEIFISETEVLGYDIKNIIS